jgi:hypothetical protein
MEQIVLEVPNDTAQKWRNASGKVKEEAAKLVEQLLTDANASTDDHNMRMQKAISFYRQHAVDFTKVDKWTREDLYE